MFKRSTLIFILTVPFYIFVFGNVANLVFTLSGHYVFFELIRRIYNFSTLVWPISLIGAGGYVLYVTWSGKGDRILARYARVCIIVAALVVSIWIYATHIEPHHLIVHTVSIQVPAIKSPLRILHISDIQSDKIGSYEEKVFARIRELNPDLILFTGDLLQTHPPTAWETELPKIAALFRTLEPPLGIYGVYGNVDGFLYGLSRDRLGDMTMLENDTVVVEWKGSRIRLAGLSLEQSWRGANDFLRSWLNEGTEDDFTIVMGHVPDFILSAKDLPIDLCLAGHTHGGQIVIPGFGPLVTLSAVPHSWARGFREIGDTRLNVSAGIGAEHAANLPSIRFFCPPDMTLFELSNEMKP